MSKFFKTVLTSTAALMLASTASADSLMDVYKHLHANPETSNMEFETAKYLSKRLKDMGFDITEGVGGTGVVALYKNGPGKTVMLRADMDALPVKEDTGLPYASTVITTDMNGDKVPAMHACGHDIHMTVAMGAAEELVSSKSEWSGTLMVVLQPAEEVGQGAKNMLEDGLYKRFPVPNYNIALHTNSALVSGKVGIVPGYALANVDSVDIVVKGIGGHGAYPQTTKDPVVLASQIVVSLQSIISREISAQEPAVLTVGSIHGGTKHNIIGEEVKLQLTLRSYTDEVREKLIKSIRRMSEGLAIAYGMPEDLLPVVTVKDEFTPSSYNDPEFAEMAKGYMSDVIGEENVVELPPVMGGEDFGRFGKTKEEIPSLIYWLGAAAPKDVRAAARGGKPLPSLHSPTFKPDAQAAIPVGVSTMSGTILNLFKN